MAQYQEVAARDELAQEVRSYVDALCGFGRDRHPGTDRNRAAVDYVAGVLRDAGIEVEVLTFAVPEWRYGKAAVEVGDEVFSAKPGPFSRGAEVEGTLLAVKDAAELEGLDARGKILLLHGDIARSQLLPRGYPWYSMPEHARILDALEEAAPLALVAATGSDPKSAGGQSPFPLTEDPRFAVPSAYLELEEGERLLAHVGEQAKIRVDSETLPSTGEQLIGRLSGRGDGRILIGGHIDTKPDTPGALDNAAGVATMLAAARLLAALPERYTIELLPFNGEDHALSPGEVAYLDAYGDLSDVRLMINIDDAGLVGAPTACSFYGLDEETEASVSSSMVEFDSIVLGPQWPSSDHMIFAMRGVPAIALVTQDVEPVMGELSHTPKDTPDKVDPNLLADAARFIARVVQRVAANS